ncbi:YjjG family noncanonical pyrimidine nucleotidase [Mesonia maritima]|uniref:YjjG family noncanonical pyrimidine nucleotidase n=1 Tax=Mesonia maritima TaxID=1793873 RepID=UPI00363925A0
MTNITDIFFDLDHTLWDFERNSALAFEKILLKNEVDLNITDFLKIYVPLNESYWKLYREDKITKEDLRFKRISETFEALNYKSSTQLIEKLADDYILHLPDNNHLFEDAISTLDYLAEKYRLHIITNGFEEVQHLKMKNAQIDHYFETVTTSENAGVKKPHPIIFEKALKKANTENVKSVMIGDNLEADIEGAEKIGMKPSILRQII